MTIRTSRLRRRIATALVALGGVVAAPALAQGPYEVIAHWHIGGDNGWDYLHIDPASQRLYVSHEHKVEVIDARSGAVIGSIDGLQGSHGIVVDGSGNYGYISDSSGGIVIFDTHTLAKVKTLPTSFGPDGIVYEPVTKTVWTFNGRGGNANATAVDTRTQQIVATIPLTKDRLEAQTADGKGHVFGNLGGDIARIDARTKMIDQQWATGCDNASGLAFDAEHNRIFQACHDQKMYVVDASNGRLLGTSPIGDRPDGAGYDAKDSLAFAPTGDGFLTVINAAAPGYPTLQKLATQAGARTMDYDPTRDRIYTISAERDPSVAEPSGPPGPPPGAPGQPNQGPQGGPPPGPRQSPYKPDSFAVIVIGRR